MEPDAEPPAGPTLPAAPQSADAWDLRAMMPWLLIALGVGLVLFAGPLAHLLVPKTTYSPTSFGWSPDEEHAIAANMKVLGAMAFAAGLVERIVRAIREAGAEARRT